MRRVRPMGGRWFDGAEPRGGTDPRPVSRLSSWWPALLLATQVPVRACRDRRGDSFAIRQSRAVAAPPAVSAASRCRPSAATATTSATVFTSPHRSPGHPAGRLRLHVGALRGRGRLRVARLRPSSCGRPGWCTLTVTDVTVPSITGSVRHHCWPGPAATPDRGDRCRPRRRSRRRPRSRSEIEDTWHNLVVDYTGTDPLRPAPMRRASSPPTTPSVGQMADGQVPVTFMTTGSQSVTVGDVPSAAS